MGSTIITDYETGKKGVFARLIEKIELGLGKLLYKNQPNDIAVSVDSINRVDKSRNPEPETFNLVCHHVNYFESEEGLKALTKILT